jgi:hypothetical protein
MASVSDITVLAQTSDDGTSAERMRPETSPRQATVRLYQNYYSDSQIDAIDPAFVPNDGRRNARTEYRELGLFARMYHRGEHLSADYTGIVSPKFGEKTHKAGAEFVDFVHRNPGYDAYFINPFPQNGYWSFNVWHHGESCHPGVMPLSQRLFDRAGIHFDLATMGRNDQRTLLYSNFWVGNERFWDAFMDVNLRLLDALERLDPNVRHQYFRRDATYHDPVPVLPFVFERLFSTLMHMRPDIKALCYPLTRQEVLAEARLDAWEYRLVNSVYDLVNEIDERGVYNAADMAVFRTLLRLKTTET